LERRSLMGRAKGIGRDSWPFWHDAVVDIQALFTEGNQAEIAQHLQMVRECCCGDGVLGVHLAPKGLKITELFDQSTFVKASIMGVLREGVIAASLTALMIRLFLGSWRSTVIIAVSIPLSILSSIIVLSAMGETMNTVTLGGLALAIGILVDDATVTIENIHRHMHSQPLKEAVGNMARTMRLRGTFRAARASGVFVSIWALASTVSAIVGFST
jgi:multidrug efflux pump subunit AcrB